MSVKRSNVMLWMLTILKLEEKTNYLTPTFLHIRNGFKKKIIIPKINPPKTQDNLKNKIYTYVAKCTHFPYKL